MEAFTEDWRNRIEHFVEDVTDSHKESYVMATFHMFFPLLTCKVKCGAAVRDIAKLADRSQHDARRAC